jgi:hypothetical protein
MQKNLMHIDSPQKLKPSSSYIENKTADNIKLDTLLGRDKSTNSFRFDSSLDYKSYESSKAMETSIRVEDGERNRTISELKNIINER